MFFEREPGHDYNKRNNEEIYNHISILILGGAMYGIFGLLILILDIIAILDVFKSSMDSTKKALWIVLILVLPVIGMVLYFLMGQRK